MGKTANQKPPMKDDDDMNEEDMGGGEEDDMNDEGGEGGDGGDGMEKGMGDVTIFDSPQALVKSIAAELFTLLEANLTPRMEKLEADIDKVSKRVGTVYKALGKEGLAGQLGAVLEQVDSAQEDLSALKKSLDGTPELLKALNGAYDANAKGSVEQRKPQGGAAGSVEILQKGVPPTDPTQPQGKAFDELTPEQAKEARELLQKATKIRNTHQLVPNGLAMVQSAQAEGRLTLPMIETLRKGVDAALETLG